MGQALDKICINYKYPPPYHIFKRLEDYFVFDTSTCHFYKIDEITYDFLKLCLKYSIKDAQKKLLKKRKFLPELINSVAQEIAILSDNGLFDIPDYSMQDEEIKRGLNRAYLAPITGIELALADTCNLACKYCYCGTSRNMPVSGLMTEDIAHQAVKWLFDASGRASKVNITFLGGEPLLNKPVIRSIVEYSQDLA
jgi:uncharacterized protein